jgi:hypothetical protein
MARTAIVTLIHIEKLDMSDLLQIPPDLLTKLEKIGRNKTFNTIIDQYVEYINSIIRNHHCPLRYQGNFINKSITSFEKIASDIQKKKSVIKDDDIGDKIKDIIKINGNIANAKLVVFTCIREDKADSIPPSLKFAHCINPLRNTGDGYLNCSTVSAGGMLAGGATYNSLLYKDYTFSQDLISKIQKVGFYNMIKAVRWRYYDVKTSEDTIETKIFADYLFTTIVATFLFSMKQEKLAFGLFVDQVISTGLYYKYNNAKVLLLPYYLPFV